MYATIIEQKIKMSLDKVFLKINAIFVNDRLFVQFIYLNVKNVTLYFALIVLQKLLYATNANYCKRKKERQ